jgi:glutamate/tyrosine decarboxylase-like PLP-dependent enzyme
VSELVERCCRHAHSLAVQIGGLPGAELVWEPTINQGLVRFLDPKPNASEEDHDRRTDQVVAAISSAGVGFFTASTWRGRRVMRISVCNWQTSEQDVARVVDSVASCLGALVSSHGSENPGKSVKQYE